MCCADSTAVSGNICWLDISNEYPMESTLQRAEQSRPCSLSFSLPVCVCVCVLCVCVCAWAVLRWFVAQENKKFKSSVVSWDKARALESMVPSNTKAFFVWSSSILSSIESFVIKRIAVTGFFWPRRWLLQMACISTAGFHPESEKKKKKRKKKQRRKKNQRN